MSKLKIGLSSIGILFLFSFMSPAWSKDGYRFYLLNRVQISGDTNSSIHAQLAWRVLGTGRAHTNRNFTITKVLYAKSRLTHEVADLSKGSMIRGGSIDVYLNYGDKPKICHFQMKKKERQDNLSLSPDITNSKCGVTCEFYYMTGDKMQLGITVSGKFDFAKCS